MPAKTPSCDGARGQVRDVAYDPNANPKARVTKLQTASTRRLEKRDRPSSTDLHSNLRGPTTKVTIAWTAPLHRLLGGRVRKRPDQSDRCGDPLSGFPPQNVGHLQWRHWEETACSGYGRGRGAILIHHRPLKH